MKCKEIFKTITDTIKLLYSASKFHFILNIFFNIFSGLFIPINIFIWKYLVDALTVMLKSGNDFYKPVLFFLFLHFCISFFSRIVSSLSVYFQTIYSTKINIFITDKILNKISELNFEEFDNPAVYNIIQKSSQESLGRSTSILRTCVEIVNNLTSVIGTIWLLIRLNAALTNVAVLSCIPLFFIDLVISNKLYSIYEKRFEKLRFINYLKHISIDNANIKEMKIYNVFLYFTKKIYDIYKQNLDEDKGVNKKIFLQRNSYQFFDEIIMYLLKLWIIILGFKTKNTIGSILMFIQSLDVLKNAISNTLSMGSQGYEDSLYMENFFKLLNIPSEKKELIFDPNFKKIEFKNVSFKYPLSDKYVIKNFSFCFNAGNTYGFVGLNGSGKTTLIKLLLGFYSSYEGKILIDGIDIREFNLETYYHYVSLVFQDFIKYPFTVVENIGLGDEALFLTQDGVKTITENKEVYQAALFSKADEFIRKLPNQYATILGKEWQNGTQISIGQWQKIAIARAAVKGSKILIFDEPTASIDLISEYEFFKSIKELAKNKLCILVTHRFANIKAADNILVFSDGELVQKGNHKKLFNIEGLYKKLYTMQAESYME